MPYDRYTHTLPCFKCGVGERRPVPGGRVGSYCRECAAAAGRNRRRDEVIRKADRELEAKKRRAQREEVIRHYGGACTCCGESRWEFLALDHVGGGGIGHIRTNGTSLPVWLRLNGFPEGFRVLCHNCNQALGHHGFCPHRPAEGLQLEGRKTFLQVFPEYARKKHENLA